MARNRLFNFIKRSQAIQVGQNNDGLMLITNIVQRKRIDRIAQPMGFLIDTGFTPEPYAD